LCYCRKSSSLGVVTSQNNVHGDKEIKMGTGTLNRNETETQSKARKLQRFCQRNCFGRNFGRDFSLPLKYTCYFMAENTIFSTTIGGIGTLKSFWYKVGNPTADTL
jgi:hypothetical protein